MGIIGFKACLDTINYRGVHMCGRSVGLTDYVSELTAVSCLRGEQTSKNDLSFSHVWQYAVKVPGLGWEGAFWPHPALLPPH